MIELVFQAAEEVRALGVIAFDWAYRLRAQYDGGRLSGILQLAQKVCAAGAAATVSVPMPLASFSGSGRRCSPRCASGPRTETSGCAGPWR